MLYELVEVGRLRDDTFLYQLPSTELEGGEAFWGQCPAVLSRQSYICTGCTVPFSKSKKFWPFRMVWNLVWVVNTVYWFRITFIFLFALAVLLYEPAVRINDAVINSHADSDAIVQWWM